MMCVADPVSLRIIKANPAICEFYGYPATELLKLTLADLCTGEAAAQLRRLGSVSAPATVELQQRCRQGSVCDVKLSIAPFMQRGKPQWWCIVHDVTSLKRSMLQQQRQREYLALLHEATLAVLEQTALEDLLHTLLEQISLLVAPDISNIFLFDQQRHILRLHLSSSSFSPIGAEVTYGVGLIGKIWASGEMIVLDDYSTWPHRLTNTHLPNTHAVAGFPLKSQDQIVGVLAVSYTAPGSTFGPDELGVLEQIGKLASLAIEKTNLYAATHSELTERRRAENSLRQLTERFQLAEEVVNGGIYDIDMLTQHTVVTAGFSRVFGYTSDDVASDMNWWSERVHPDDRSFAIDDYLHALPTANSFTATYRFRIKSGEYRYVFDNVKILRDDHGQLLRVVGSMTDVTDQLQSERALQASEERYRSLVEASPYAIGIVVDNHLMYLNPTGLRLIGAASLEDVLLLPIAQFLPTSDDYDLDIYERLPLAEGEMLRLAHVEYRDLQGRTVCAELTLVGTSYQNQAATLVLGHDITDRVRAEQSLREREEQYRQMVDLAPMPIIVHRHGAIVYVNARAVEYSGATSAAEIVGRSILAFVHHDDHPTLQAELDDPAVGSTAAIVRFLHATAGVRHVEYSATVVEYGGSPARQMILNDITLRKYAEEQRLQFERRLLETQKLESLGVLAGGIAHDFNNLLVSILGNASLALYDLPPDSPAYTLIQNLERAARQAADLTNQMLMYSGRSLIEMCAINLGTLVQEMLHLLQVSIAKSAQLVCDIPADLPFVQGDPTQLRQVVMNLVINASEALAASGGTISVSLGTFTVTADYLAQHSAAEQLAVGEYVYLDVSDTGGGMDAETQARMFEPFFTTKFTGRGLGLAAVQGIVRSHAGALHVVSNLGHGTTVRMLLPQVQQSAPQPAADPPAQPSAEPGGTILVIDDEPDVRMVVERILKRLGFKVISAADGASGVRLLRQHESEIRGVLLDLTMPTMDGETTLQQLQLIQPDLKVILMSGYNEQMISERFRGRNLVGFLSKPFMISDLREKLALFNRESAG